MDYATTLLARLPGALKRDHGMRRLIETLEAYLPEDQVESVMHAYDFGAAAHEGQKRKSGEAYISHPVAVAQELADMHLDSQAITAAILHDVVEDTDVSIADIRHAFGAEVAELVDGVTKISKRELAADADGESDGASLPAAGFGDVSALSAPRGGGGSEPLSAIAAEASGAGVTVATGSSTWAAHL